MLGTKSSDSSSCESLLLLLSTALAMVKASLDWWHQDFYDGFCASSPSLRLYSTLLWYYTTICWLKARISQVEESNKVSCFNPSWCLLNDGKLARCSVQPLLPINFDLKSIVSSAWCKYNKILYHIHIFRSLLFVPNMPQIRDSGKKIYHFSNRFHWRTNEGAPLILLLFSAKLK